MALREIIIFYLIFWFIAMPSHLNLCFAEETNQTRRPNEIDFIVTLNLNGPSEITIVHLLNNSGSTKAIGSIYVDYYESHEIIGKPEIEIASRLRQENIKNNVTSNPEGGFTRINGTIWNIKIEPYEVIYVSLKYKVLNACERNPKDVKHLYEGYLLRFMNILKARKVSYIVKIPRFSDITRIYRLKFHYMSPYPSEIIEDESYLWLIWKEPTQILEDGRYLFRPFVLFNYEFDYQLFVYAALGFLVAFTLEKGFSLAIKGLQSKYHHKINKIKWLLRSKLMKITKRKNSPGHYDPC